MAAIFIKIGSLMVKTLAKPLSSYFTASVMANPVARQYVIKASQSIHRVEVWITRSAEGKTGRAFVGEMTEAKSIEMASKLASEGFVFGVGTVIVMYEFERQREKDVTKKRAEAEERRLAIYNAQQEHESLARAGAEQRRLIQLLAARMDGLERSVQHAMGITEATATGGSAQLGTQEAEGGPNFPLDVNGSANSMHKVVQQALRVPEPPSDPASYPAPDPALERKKEQAEYVASEPTPAPRSKPSTLGGSMEQFAELAADLAEELMDAITPEEE